MMEAFTAFFPIIVIFLVAIVGGYDVERGMDIISATVFGCLAVVVFVWLGTFPVGALMVVGLLFAVVLFMDKIRGVGSVE